VNGYPLATTRPGVDFSRLRGTAMGGSDQRREAEVKADGLTLGPGGGRIVAEVLVGLIESDPASFLVQQPRWTPTLTSAGAGFRVTDFLTFAGVDPASRGSNTIARCEGGRRGSNEFPSSTSAGCSRG
jgi:hypothetical protein